MRAASVAGTRTSPTGYSGDEMLQSGSENTWHDVQDTVHGSTGSRTVVRVGKPCSFVGLYCVRGIHVLISTTDS